MSRVNGHDPGRFPGRPDHFPSDRNINAGGGGGGGKKSGGFCSIVAFLLVAAATSAVWGLVELVASVWPS